MVKLHAERLGILLMNSKCIAIYFQQHFSYVVSDISKDFYPLNATENGDAERRLQ